MVWYVGRGYVIQNSQSVSESVTKVGIELLGQLKKWDPVLKERAIFERNTFSNS